MKKIPFLGFRSISNYVEPRDKSKWKMKEAIENLCKALIDLLEESEYNVDRIFNIVSSE